MRLSHSFKRPRRRQGHRRVAEASFDRSRDVSRLLEALLLELGVWDDVICLWDDVISQWDDVCARAHVCMHVCVCLSLALSLSLALCLSLSRALSLSLALYSLGFEDFQKAQSLARRVC